MWLVNDTPPNPSSEPLDDSARTGASGTTAITPPNLCPPIFSHVEHYSVDLFWSFLSDSFFIAGGFAYIALTVWDYYLYHHHAVSRIDVETDESALVSAYNDDDGNGSSSDSVWYIGMDVLAPSVYLLNSMVDIYWTTRVQQRLQDVYQLQRQGRQRIEIECRPSQVERTLLHHATTDKHVQFQYSHTNDTDADNVSHYNMTLRGISFSSVSTIVEPRWTMSWWHKMCQHAAHRRTVLAALAFGLAASLAVVAAVVRNNLLPVLAGTVILSPSVDNVLDACSDHMYIVSALISLTGSRVKGRATSTTASRQTSRSEKQQLEEPILVTLPWWYNDNERLEHWGDILFLLGCLMDATLTDFSLKHLLLLPIISSILWLLDGCLYMRSDFVRAARLHDWRRSILQDTEQYQQRYTSRHRDDRGDDCYSHTGILA